MPGPLTGLICGAVNGFFVAYVGMSSFVVTLGMTVDRALHGDRVSGNQMLYKFGPDAPIVKAIGQGRWPLQGPTTVPDGTAALLAFLDHGGPCAYRWFRFQFHAWARHLFAIGGNEEAARLTGVPVDWIKFQAYVFSAFTSA